MLCCNTQVCAERSAQNVFFWLLVLRNFVCMVLRSCYRAKSLAQSFYRLQLLASHAGNASRGPGLFGQDNLMSKLGKQLTTTLQARQISFLARYTVIDTGNGGARGHC